MSIYILLTNLDYLTHGGGVDKLFHTMVISKNPMTAPASLSRLLHILGIVPICKKTVIFKETQLFVGYLLQLLHR